MSTPLEPVKGSWDIEITTAPGVERTPALQATIDAFANEISKGIAIPAGIPEGIVVVTLRKLL